MMQSISQLAALTGMAKETISKRLNAAGLEFTPGPKCAKLYETGKGLAAIYGAPQSDQGELMRARCKNLDLDSELKKQRHAIAAGELIAANVVERVWGGMTGAARDPPKSFREFVEAPPLRGLGEKLSDIERLIADDAESLVRLRELIVAGHGGDRKSEKIKADNVSLDSDLFVDFSPADLPRNEGQIRPLIEKLEHNGERLKVWADVVATGARYQGYLDGCRPPTYPQSTAYFSYSADIIPPELIQKTPVNICTEQLLWYYTGMKNLHIALDSEQHRKLKIAAAMRGISIAELVKTALNPTIGTVTQAHISMRPSMESRPLETR